MSDSVTITGTLVVVLPGAANQEKYPSNDPSPHLFVSAVSPPVIIPSSADCSLQSPARQPNLVTGLGTLPVHSIGCPVFADEDNTLVFSLHTFIAIKLSTLWVIMGVILGTG